jgi:ABC-type multidrug transport system ATPase subunit
MQIELKNISFSYQNKFIIKKANNVFKSGDIHFINGKNGSGKTTLLKLLATFLTPNYGNILYDGVDLKSIKKNKKNYISYITHLPILYPELTLKENFKLFVSLNKLENKSISDLRNDFNLIQYNDIQIKKYSRGMKQKASIALSLLFDYSVYLFDEPFSGLDIESQEVLNKYIVELSKKDKLIILISHHINKIENSISYTLENGRITIDD